MTITVFGITALISAWQNPTEPPPGGNVSGFLDTSSTTQTKAGNLTIGGTLTASTTLAVNATTTLATASGNVGIGTAAPANKLDIVTGATTDSTIHVGETVTNGGFILSTLDSQILIFGGAEYSAGAWVARDTSASGVNLYGGDVIFYANTGLTDNATFTPTTLMTLDGATGHLGINVAPISTAKLYINTPTASASGLLVKTSDNSAAYPGIDFQKSDGNSFWKVVPSGTVQQYTTNIINYMDSYSATAGVGGRIYFRHSKAATIGTLTASASGDNMGFLLAQGVDSAGSAWRTSSYITFEVDAAPGATYVPGRIDFYTTNTAGTSALALTIDSTNQLYVGSFSSAGSKALCWDNAGASYINDCASAPAADIAEYYAAESGVEPGDVVSLATSSAILLQKSGMAYDTSVMGVISTDPTGPNGEAMGQPLVDKDKNPQPLALTGRVPVKVSLENGPIKIGDWLTSSSKPGVAMKAAKDGAVIGRALENYDGSQQISTEVAKVHQNMIEQIKQGYETDLKKGRISQEEVDKIVAEKSAQILPKQPEQGVGKIMVNVEVRVPLPEENKTADSSWQELVKNLRDKTASFSEAIIGKLTASAIEAKQLIVNGIDILARLNDLATTQTKQQEEINSLRQEIETLKTTTILR